MICTLTYYPVLSLMNPSIYYWGEPERAPQFGDSSSSSAMHYGAFARSLYVRTRNFSYSDLNPTGFSPRTGYFENFQSLYSDLE
jgi:hypothetical protein